MIYVPQKLIRNTEVTNVDVATWCFTNVIVYGPLKDYDIVTPAQIAFHMFGTANPSSHSVIDEIYKSLQHLLETNMLHGERVNSRFYKILKSSFAAETPFVKVEQQDLFKIIAETVRPYSVIRNYLYLLSTIDPNTKCGTWKNDTIIAGLEEDETVLTRSYKVLEKLELLYVYRAVQSSNTYGRFEDKEEIIKIGKQRSNNRTLHLSSNVKRKYTQLYNQVKAGNKKYTDDPLVMSEIYDFCQSINDQENKQIYDLSIFT